MDKTAVEKFAVWARKKLIRDITYKAGLLGVTETGLSEPISESTKDIQLFDIGTYQYTELRGKEISQRRAFVNEISRRARSVDFSVAFKEVMEEVAYTWFNRLIAIRFMEVNGYLPSRMRVLSSDVPGKIEPDLVTHPYDWDFTFSEEEKEQIKGLQTANKMDELFRLLFIKQCNQLHNILPLLFEPLSDYTELLLPLSYTDPDGLVQRLVHDIDETNFDVARGGQIEIVGWFYQYYNSELKDLVYSDLKKNIKITRNKVPAATQLFTPNWVVKYMVENALGRLWLEGHPDSSLRSGWRYYIDEAPQTEAVTVALTDRRASRSVANPEAIKIIDPCMGSGHILVYAFDVMMDIYQSCGYSQKEAAIYIVNKNLYGLDIDQRAFQLAYFAVIMKARAYNRNIFKADLHPNLFAIRDADILTTDLVDLICDGAAELKADVASIKEDLSEATEYGSIISVRPVNFSKIKDRLNEIIDELPSLYSTVVKDDVVPLINQAEVMANLYDCVITNPPYIGSNNIGPKLYDYVKKNYLDSRYDLFAVFIQRCAEMVRDDGYQAMITQHAWMFLKSYERLRKVMLSRDLVNMVHLGTKAFEEIGGAVVQTTSFVVRNTYLKHYKGVYCRLVEGTTQKGKEAMFLAGKNRFVTAQDNFADIPGAPLAYWASPAIFEAYKQGQLMEKVVDVRQGLATTNNNLFLRYWYEVDKRDICFSATSPEQSIASKKKWFPYNKGGMRRQWYGNYDFVINWEDDGRDIRAYKKRPGGSRSGVSNYTYYFREAVTWSLISSSTFSIRYREPGSIHDVAGMSAFAKDQDDLFYILGLMGTKLSDHVLQMINPTINMQVGDFMRFPVLDMKDSSMVINLVKDNIALSKFDWNSFETSWDYMGNPLLNLDFYIDKLTNVVTDFKIPAWVVDLQQSNFLRDRVAAYKWLVNSVFDRVHANEITLNKIFIDLYGLTDELTPEISATDITVSRICDDWEKEASDITANPFVLTEEDVVKLFVSFTVGCMLGRYSPFNSDVQVVQKQNPEQEAFISITDEYYSDADLTGQFVKFIEQVLGAETLPQNVEYIGEILGQGKKEGRLAIRHYFLSNFYSDHVKMYKKRPIYWQFDSGKQNGFKALIYMQRWSADLIGDLRVSGVHWIQRIYENEIKNMDDLIEHSDSARERREAERRRTKLQKQLKETRDYDGKIGHLANERKEIDLDDGVKWNYKYVQTSMGDINLNILSKI